MSSVEYQMDLTVITLADGLKHNYFSYISWYKDNESPMGIGKLVIPLDSTMLKYWNNYYDVVIISAKLKNNKENTNSKDYYKKIIAERKKLKSTSKQTKYSKKQKDTLMKIFKQKVTNEEYNFSFIGRISNIHKQGQQATIELQDIGWKFMQKIPDDFRKQYIAGQPLDDAFQAMCEFMGVEFAYSLTILHDYTFGADGFSVTKNSETIEAVPNTLQEIKEDKTGILDADKIMEDENLIKLSKKLKAIKKGNEKDSSEASSAINSKKQESSNGPSNSIQENIKNKIEYVIDFESRIKDLFIGNAYYNSELTSLNFNYDAITIEPKTTSESSSISKTEDPISQDPKNIEAAKKRITGNTKQKLSDNPNIATLQRTAQLGQQSRLTSVNPPNTYLINRQVITTQK